MKNNEIILSIETSCDDTSISICKNGKIITTLTKTTLVQHKKYGGIVPEIAARGHEQNLAFLCVNALKNSKISFANLTKIAYTNFPGLPGSLHIGKIFANSLGFLLNIPVVPINHLLGHVFSFSINKNKKIEYPFIGLVISGGNTIIYLVKNIYECSILNQTKDDAVGETLDKIGRLLGYEYPGGI
jgi:N6-L-threonylcarbamoyladenine synthase